MGKTRALGVLTLILGLNLIPAADVAMASPAAHDCGVLVDSWLTDTEFNPLPGGEFKVLTRRNGSVITTNPGGFYYNLLLEAEENVSNLAVHVALPAGFSTWGHNPVHVYLNEFDPAGPDDEDAVHAGDSLSFGPVSLAAGDRLYVTVHVRYTQATVAPGELPKVYTFSATASGPGFFEPTSASLTGLLKK